MSEHRCLRCKNVSLKELEPIDLRITFFECPSCRRHYALQPGKPLTFRWGHPISLPLYSVIFDDAPAQRAAAVAASFVKQRSPEQVERFVGEIKLELEEPTQQVRDILDCRATEPELREYLCGFVEHVEQLLAARRRQAPDDAAE